MKCRICDNESGNKSYTVREMMFGTRDEFLYFQCASCKCLQIASPPHDVSKYYPAGYYSFSSESFQNKNIFKNWLRIKRDYYAIFRKGLIGKLVNFFMPDKMLLMLSHCNLNSNKSILDVGCGNGYLLYKLRECGFKNLQGTDPYIENDIIYQNGLKIQKKSIYEITGTWDLIMLHHSFEHMDKPEEVLTTISSLLNTNGICLLRIPTVSSYSWGHFRTNWVQLDAPRHFFLHSVESINLLAKKANLSLENIVYDSRDFQFWGSIQYEKDIPLNDSRSYSVNPKQSIFTKAEIMSFKKKANELNLANNGDSAAFFLVKK